MDSNNRFWDKDMGGEIVNKPQDGIAFSTFRWAKEFVERFNFDLRERNSISPDNWLMFLAVLSTLSI